MANRRSWIKLIAHSPWLALLFARRGQAQVPAPALPGRELEILVDTLVPADESPGAVDLGIHTAMEVTIRQSPEYLDLLRLGVAWLDQEAGQRYRVTFSETSQEAREALLTAAEKSPRRSPQHRLFSVLRTDVLQRYYTHPDAWAGLGFAGPPQPVGFVDYRKAPATPVG